MSLGWCARACMGAENSGAQKGVGKDARKGVGMTLCCLRAVSIYLWTLMDVALGTKRRPQCQGRNLMDNCLGL